MYGKPREGTFRHFDHGTIPCVTCDTAVLTWRATTNEWLVTYFKGGREVDSRLCLAGDFLSSWNDGWFRPIYSPRVALPEGV